MFKKIAIASTAVMLSVMPLLAAPIDELVMAHGEWSVRRALSVAGNYCYFSTTDETTDKLEFAVNNDMQIVLRLTTDQIKYNPDDVRFGFMKTIRILVTDVATSKYVYGADAPMIVDGPTVFNDKTTYSISLPRNGDEMNALLDSIDKSQIIISYINSDEDQIYLQFDLRDIATNFKYYKQCSAEMADVGPEGE